MKMIKFRSYRENIGLFSSSKPSLPILWPSVVFNRLRQQLRERRKNLWHAKNLAKSSRKLIFVLTSCVHFAYRKAIVMASCQIVTSSILFRLIIGGIGHFSIHEDNTKETRSCPIVLRRHHDYVKPSQKCRVVIVFWYDGILGSCCWWRQPNFSRCNACRMCHGTTKFELLMSFTRVMESWAYKRQTSEHNLQSVLSHSTRQRNL